MDYNFIRELTGVHVLDINGREVGDKPVEPLYVVATFRVINGTVAIDSSVYVGYNYITKGDPVLVCQAALLTAGYDPGVLDGIFGPNTHAAVISFQKDQRLSVDATVGPKTWGTLDEACSGKVLPIYIATTLKAEEK